MSNRKRAPWSDAEYLHLIDLVEDRFAPFRQHGLGSVFWRTVADEMNAAFGTSRTASACQTTHSQLSTGVIPRPEAVPEPAAVASFDGAAIKALMLDFGQRMDRMEQLMALIADGLAGDDGEDEESPIKSKDPFGDLLRFYDEHGRWPRHLRYPSDCPEGKDEWLRDRGATRDEYRLGMYLFGKNKAERRGFSERQRRLTDEECAQLNARGYEWRGELKQRACGRTAAEIHVARVS